MNADDRTNGLESAEDAAVATTRVRLDIAYDGTDFHGWGRQPALRTVQGELESALARVFTRAGDPPTLTVAGRTDAGVHATGQVAHLDLTEAQCASLNRARQSARHPRGVQEGIPSLARRLNGIAGLDTDVYVRGSRIAPLGFDARFSAVWRRYEYRVADTVAERIPVHRRETLWYPRELDVTIMNEAAGALLGLHDWASFCKARDDATSIRTLQDFRWDRLDDGVLRARVQADAFCHSMVRALVGATIAVGEGALDAHRLLALRDDLQRTAEFKVAPAKGLTMTEVGYPEDTKLRSRAEQTRARRAVPPSER